MNLSTNMRIALASIVGVIFLYLLAVGLISSPSSKPFNPAPLDANASNQERAKIMAQGVTYALDNQLSSFFGFLPNDLITPWFIDNTTNFQRGVIYATRPASEVIAHDVGRFGTRDTIDIRLSDATSRYFSYSENAWGFLFVYDAETKYRQGILNWADWAQSVGTNSKNAGVYNMKSDDVYNIIQYCITMTDFALGILNEANTSHFKADNNIYFAKGVSAVVGNVFRALLAVDDSVILRGGKENVKEALNRFNYIDNFNPIYVMAGGNNTGDALLPNHVASLARHLDVANSRLNDILQSMSR